jgi:hypothetical protein
MLHAFHLNEIAFIYLFELSVAVPIICFLFPNKIDIILIKDFSVRWVVLVSLLIVSLYDIKVITISPKDVRVRCLDCVRSFPFHC